MLQVKRKMVFGHAVSVTPQSDMIAALSADSQYVRFYITMDSVALTSYCMDAYCLPGALLSAYI